jgi:hypothetical protein
MWQSGAVLTPILATEEPYEAAAVFIKAGWALVFETPRDSRDPLACVALAGARLMLGTSLPQFLPVNSRAHKGAGVEFHVTVPSEEISAVYGRTASTPNPSPTLPCSHWVSRRSTRSCLGTVS